MQEHVSKRNDIQRNEGENMNKKQIGQILAPVKKGGGTCFGCKYFYLDPENNKSHYYISEGEAQGECIFLKPEKIGTTSMSKKCKHWEMQAEK